MEAASVYFAATHIIVTLLYGRVLVSWEKRPRQSITRGLRGVFLLGSRILFQIKICVRLKKLCKSVMDFVICGTRTILIWTFLIVNFFCLFVIVSETNEAVKHARKVAREGGCQWPRPRVISVRDVYPSPSTTYIPHCAILHRCSDDTGCCRSEALTCVPKVSHKVELHFFVST